jgi:hypothetical protein
MSPQGSALGLVVIKLSNIAHKNIYIIYRIVTSVLAWRETHRTETNPLFRGLKFLPRENIKLWSVCRCSLVVSLQGFGLQ